MGIPFLARLTALQPVRRAGRVVKTTWKRLFFGPLHAHRKARFSALGTTLTADLPVAALQLDSGCGCKACRNFVPLTQAEFRSYARPGRKRRQAPAFAETAAIIELSEFAGFEPWRIGVSQRTSGKYHRAANKARRLGYSARVIGKDSYARSVYRLTGSKLRRSKGLFVWAAIAGPRADLVDTKAPPLSPGCPRHWRVCWGGFSTTETSETLAAFAILIRAGDTVWVQRLIGHGAALSDGVTKLLIFDIMQWLLDRTDPNTHGIARLVHGSVEEGGAGLYDWKRYLGFRPMLLEFNRTAD